MHNGQQLIVKRDEVETTQWVPRTWGELKPGQALLQVGPMAFTSNNISYAVLGKMFRYWDFFPVPEDGFGCIPVWGYADVVDTGDTELRLGERIYGYFPMATYLTVEPGRVNDRRFVDEMDHRGELPPVYNDYMRVASDPSHTADKERHRALFFPLAVTAYGLSDWIEQTDAKGAEAIGLISASSKTAIALATLLKERGESRPVIGFTSDRNIEVVSKLDLYDRVLGYDQFTDVDATMGHVLIDFAGNANFSAKLHGHLGDNMRHNALVGASHPDAPRKAEGMDHDRSELFFMPAYAQARITETKGEFVVRMQAAGAAVSDAAQRWMRLREATTPAAADALYAAVLTGQLEPDEGGIIDFAHPDMMTAA